MWMDKLWDNIGFLIINIIEKKKRPLSTFFSTFKSLCCQHNEWVFNRIHSPYYYYGSINKII